VASEPRAQSHWSLSPMDSPRGAKPPHADRRRRPCANRCAADRLKTGAVLKALTHGSPRPREDLTINCLCLKLQRIPLRATTRLVPSPDEIGTVFAGLRPVRGAPATESGDWRPHAHAGPHGARLRGGR